MNALETPSKPLQERSPRSSVYENGGRLLVSKRNFVEEDQSPSQRQSSQVSPTLQSQDDSGTKVSQLPYITSKQEQPKAQLLLLPKSHTKTRSRKPLFLRMIEAGNKLKEQEENERKEARLKRKLELQRGNFSLAGIREHIARHDEMMMNHQKEFQQISPLRRLRNNRRHKLMEEGGGEIPASNNIRNGGTDDELSVGGSSVESSFITEAPTGSTGKKLKKKRLKTKFNERAKNDMIVEKILKGKSKLELQDRLRRKEEFIENVSKHRKPSPRRLEAVAGAAQVDPIISTKGNKSKLLPSPNANTKSTESVSSITAMRVLENNVGSLVISQLQVSPRGLQVSPRSSAAEIQRASSKLLKPAGLAGMPASQLQQSSTVSSNDASFAMDDNDPDGDLPILSQFRSQFGEGNGNGTPFAKYEYPANFASIASVEDDGDLGSSTMGIGAVGEQHKSTRQPFQRSQWVDQLLVPDPEEDNLAEVYEAGFSLYLAEKGITVQK